MKNFKIKSYKLLTIILSGFILVTTASCSKKQDKTNDNYSTNNSYVETIKEENSSSTQETVSENKESTSKESETRNNTSTEIINNSSQQTNKETSDYTTDDKEVINYFNSVETKVDTVLESESVTTAKDKLKGTFISIVDFIFYDSEINGIKFNDLTEEAKQNILDTASTIDSKIMTKYPNYKEEISDKTSKAYKKASELIKSGANKISDFSKEKLGEENYNSIINAKDELVHYTKNAVDLIGNIAGNIWESGKSKIKTWYESFSN